MGRPYKPTDELPTWIAVAATILAVIVFIATVVMRPELALLATGVLGLFFVLFLYAGQRRRHNRMFRPPETPKARSEQGGLTEQDRRELRELLEKEGIPDQLKDDCVCPIRKPTPPS